MSSTAEMDALVAGPFAVLALVAGADGEVDPKEVRRFQELLEAGAESMDPALANILGRANKEAEQHIARFVGNSAGAEAALRGLKAAGDSALSPEQSQAYRTGLLMMGERIAQASGGGLFGLGQHTDGAEAKALDKLRELLDVQV